ncbi:MAG: hypothetical protein ACYSX0_12600 [Planctomycetota bacterium]
MRVECYSGYRGEQEPRKFTVGEHSVEVIEIVDRWLAPDHRYFKVEGNDGHIYILRHLTEPDEWEIEVDDPEGFAS